jgi:hypothetical protein
MNKGYKQEQQETTRGKKDRELENDCVIVVPA